MLAEKAYTEGGGVPIFNLARKEIKWVRENEKGKKVS